MILRIGAADPRCDISGCVLHTDSGSQLRSRKHVRFRARHPGVRLMRRVGAAGENIAAGGPGSLTETEPLSR